MAYQHYPLAANIKECKYIAGGSCAQIMLQVVLNEMPVRINRLSYFCGLFLNIRNKLHAMDLDTSQENIILNFSA
jgi:ABC-type uncharacterized transport system ATPase subunit